MRFVGTSALAIGTAAIFFSGISGYAAPDDGRIERSAKDSYVFKTYLSGDDIHVKARDGIVILTGSVQDEAQTRMAEDTAANLPGVNRVDNQLEVRAAREHSDDWLALKVKSALLFHRDTGANISVSAHDGLVTIRGEARDPEQKRVASDYAKNVDGVRAVDNEMVIVNGAPPPSHTAQNIGARIDDASVTAQVKMALISHEGLDALHTKIHTRDGTVVITGEAIDRAQKELVTRVAKDVNGVTTVDNEMVVR